MGTELKFGTSGLRDTVENMTDKECYINTRGFIEFLRGSGEISGKDPGIALGGDLRESTGRIMAAVAKAVEDSGCRAISCGRLPSPALAYYSIKNNMPGIMVTGSHIPEDRNGIKFTKRSGEVLKSDEEHILRGVASIREKWEKEPGMKALFDKDGKFKVSCQEPDPLAEREAEDLYVERYTRVFPKNFLKDFKIVFYQHSAVGRDIVERVLKDMGAEVVSVGRSERFVPVDTEKISDDTLRLLKGWAAEYSPSVIVSTDGDSDRPLVADEKGAFIPGDKLGALVSLYLRPDFAAVPVSANDAVLPVLQEQNIKVEQTKIGSPYVIKSMIEEKLRVPGAKVVSWESNGGFLLGADWKIEGAELEALPTRDAILPVLALLAFAKKTKLSLSELVVRSLPPRYTDAGVADNSSPGCEEYTAEIGRKIVKMFTPVSGDVSQVVFRGEEIEVMGKPAEDVISKQLKNISGALREYFNPTRGFSSIESVNFVDGIRIKFCNGDVVHLRPSGNAPEFRVYANADTPERAREIVSFKDTLVAAMMSDILGGKPGSLGAMAAFSNNTDPVVAAAVRDGIPFLIEPYPETKVWGINGIGEFWYGPGTEDKSSTAVVDSHRASMWSLMLDFPGELLGGRVLEKFGQMAPLVKILTPKGRLSVQFHDSKNELWVVTSCDDKVSGGRNWVILGFSRDSIEKYGKDVTKHYGKALAFYGEKLNALIGAIEASGADGEKILIETGNVLAASDAVKDKIPAVANASEVFIKAKNEVEFFYAYRFVSPGDVIPVPSGTLHALGPGVCVIEPQIPGPTQSLEDGTTYPVRYYFPGYERPGALKSLDTDRVDEMRPEVTPDIVPEIIDRRDGYFVERLPGNFAEKGLEAHRITFNGTSLIKVEGNSVMRSMVASKGRVFICFDGRELPVPQASPGGKMAILPATLSRYDLRSEGDAQIIDTFTPL